MKKKINKRERIKDRTLKINVEIERDPQKERENGLPEDEQEEQAWCPEN